MSEKQDNNQKFKYQKTQTITSRFVLNLDLYKTINQLQQNERAF